MRDPMLWNRIERYEIGGGDAKLSFTDKLRKAEGWSDRQAVQAILEYKRFVYLSAVSETPVTPSAPVDKVWHLHLLYTHDYWDEFCAKVLGTRLHHVPASGPSENPKHAAQYSHTWELYQTEFASLPPRALWPAPKLSGRARRFAIWVLVFVLLCPVLSFGLRWFYGADAWPLYVMGSIIGAAVITSALANAFGGGFSLSYETGSGGDCGGD